MKNLAVVILILVPLFANAGDAALAKRMDRISFSLMGRPYVGDPLGEGEAARFDRDPRFRMDGFDCTTFVETVTALAKARDPIDVDHWMDVIRYAHGEVGFETRNHFTGLDWIKNNTENGLVSDITRKIAQDGTAIAEALIEKDGWYSMLKANRLSGISEEDREARLEELHALSLKYGKEIERIPYLKKEFLVEHPKTLSRIPNAAIINIVRPAWDLRHSIGTHLNVSHQGFAFWKKGILYFRHASVAAAQVTEEPLLDYLRKTLSSDSVGGINVLIVR